MERYQVNREVKTVFVRNGADLSRLEFSFSSRTVQIRGELVKLDNSHFKAEQIEELARDISRIPAVREIHFELKNWNIASSGDSWQITKTRKSPREEADARILEIRQKKAERDPD